MTTITQSIESDDFSGPQQSPFQENWRIFKKNKMALASLIALILLLVIAVLGKIFTELVVVFDPRVVRLAAKFLPPFSIFDGRVTPMEDAPAFGIYLLGTDELGRDVFARMLSGTFVSLTVGFVAVGISVILGIFFGGLAGSAGSFLARYH